MAEHGFVTGHPTPTTATRRAPAPPSRDTRGSHGTNGLAAATIVIRPWYDPTVDRRGHDPRSDYVERFWLGVLGPSATWLIRRLAAEADAAGPSGTRIDLVAIAQSMGMSYTPGRSSPFARAIQRCVMFNVAHHTADGLAVRRRLPNVAERHLRKLPPSVMQAHDRWIDDDRERRGPDDAAAA